MKNSILPMSKQLPDWNNVVPPPTLSQAAAAKLTAMEMELRKRMMSMPNFPPKSPWTAYDRLRMRLNMEHDEEFGFDCINIYEGPNTVFVFIVTGEKAIILEDSKGIFPSDRIVAQVRLMQEQI